ncbi:MAG: hypothetical protein M3352_04785 [Bacteroidota bacterium]|nr:hypothetical protein [Bacteroidota bacterium]
MTGKQIKEYLEGFGITPSSVVHRSEEIVVLRFNYNNEIIEVIKSFKGKWSKTHKLVSAKIKKPAGEIYKSSC